MEWWQALILGLVEGITEYLPISSTGHLIIASGLMGLDDPASKSAVDAFTIVVQGGAILAVLGLYRARVVEMVMGVLGKNPAGLRLAMLLLAAFLPAAVLGVLLNDWIEARLFFLGPVVAALAVGGVFMIVLEVLRERHMRRKAGGGHALVEPGREMEIADLTFRHALLIGLMQCIAMWPGTSRSMMTIAGGVLVGLKPKQAAEFSFLLGLPTLGGATVYTLAKNLKETHDAGGPNMFEVLGLVPVLIGVVAATISAAMAVKWLVSFLNRHGLIPFGVYRLVLAGVLLALGLAGVVAV
ncbi:MAG: undecaprenyl-diphosphate phosphatase [Phycisphaeraceae bacterium]|nr:undecaprenyl-diphosphate phosphatase [Phycisphaeraceae bacterium]